MIRSAAIAAICLASLPAAAFDLEGHRGARGLAPEDTLPAFATALSIGVATLELDVNLTRDGHLLVAHNRQVEPSLAREPDGQWLSGPGPLIWQTPLATLRQFDVGRLNPAAKYGKGFPEQKPVDGTPMSLLEEVFALVRKSGNQTVRFNIETKLDPTRPEESASPEQLTEALIEAIRAGGMAERSMIESFDWRTLQIAARLAPEIPRAHLTLEGTRNDNVQRGRPDASPWLAGLDADDYPSAPALVKAANGQVWSPFWRNVTPDLVAEAHRLGLRVVPWTVNDPAVMEQLIDMKVDGLISDYPDRLRNVMQARRLPLPQATPVSP